MPRRWTDTPKIDGVGVADVFDSWSEPFTFEPGHRLRGHRCAICATMIGSTPVRNVTIIDMRLNPCGCGAIPTGTFMVCTSHGIQLDAAFAERLHQHWLDHHGLPPC